MEVNEYWRKRLLLLRETEQNMTVEYLHALEGVYNSAIAEAEKDLATFYARLAKNNEISVTAARRYLDSAELPGFRMTLKEYQEMAAKMDLPEEYQRMLENASLRIRISRLEAAKIQLQHHATTLMKTQMDGMEYFLQGLYIHSYSHGAYEIFKGAGMTFSEVGVDADSVAKLIRKPWAVDGANFSERVWGEHRPRLVNNLSTRLGKMVATGEAPDKTIKAIAKEFQTSKSAAVRLVQTEASFFAEQAKLDMYDELDVEEYEFQSSLRERTCPECGALDGMHWKITEKEPGINFPPIHPNCTICTTIPYVDPADLENNTRAAKDKDGKTVYIPRNMKYDEYKELYLVGGKKGDTLPPPRQNKGFDKATLDYWERMKQIYRPNE